MISHIALPIEPSVLELLIAPFTINLLVVFVASAFTQIDEDSTVIPLPIVTVLVSVASAILNKSGRDEQAMMVTVAGILVVMLMLVDEVGALIESVRAVFEI